MRRLHAQQVQENSHLHVQQPVAAAQRLTRGGISLPVLLVLSKHVPILTDGHKERTHIMVKWNLMTKPQQQSQGQQLQRRKPDGSRGMRAATQARATAINHGVACKLNTKAATKIKKLTEMRRLQMARQQTYAYILAAAPTKSPVYLSQNTILSRARSHAQCVLAYDKRILMQKWLRMLYMLLNRLIVWPACRGMNE